MFVPLFLKKQTILHAFAYNIQKITCTLATTAQGSLCDTNHRTKTKSNPKPKLKPDCNHFLYLWQRKVSPGENSARVWLPINLRVLNGVKCKWKREREKGKQHLKKGELVPVQWPRATISNKTPQKGNFSPSWMEKKKKGQQYY